MKAFCLSIDVVNADKPTGSLAFLAGVCEKIDIDYECLSFNAVMLETLSRDEYQALYESIKFGTESKWFESISQAIDKLIKHINHSHSDFLLVSFFSFMQFNLGKHFLQLLKQQCPSICIVAGGPGINTIITDNKSNGKILCELGLIDYYVLGEGDEILQLFLQGQRDLLGLNSVVSKFETWVPQIDQLDEKYVVPSYKKINMGVYHNLEGKSKGVLTINTSRGCVRSCSFCNVANTWPKFRFRSGKKIAQEVIKHWKDTGIPNFYISDSLINGSLKSFKDFNFEMTKLKQEHPELKDFSYNGMFIVRDKKSHPEELFEIMSAAGCESIAIGIETGSDRLRAAMNKKFTNEDLDWHFEMCQKYNIRNFLLMFTGHFNETQEDFEQTLDFLSKNQKYLIDDTIVGINFSGAYSLLPGTPDWNEREDAGIEIIQNQNDSRINWISKNNVDLTVKERVLRDLKFRKHAAMLRYGLPYNQRYLDYLQHIDKNFIPMSD